MDEGSPALNEWPTNCRPKRETTSRKFGFISDNPAAADKLEGDIYAACELLAKSPHLGHKRPDLTEEPVLFWPVRGQYLVIYMAEAEPPKIVRILHGARNVFAEFQ